MSDHPTATIIISAYNRPQVVAYAIKSVLASDFDDWELVIVGDGCNAETEAAIKAFTDPRIRFHNLPENTGHQSAPHNKGVEMARGDYVFFLNQDDMYFPDHISTRVDFMRKTGADVSWSPILLLQQSGKDSGPVDPDRDRLILDGAVADGKFHPKSFVISSCWAVRREICNQVGPWLATSQTRLSPSQEWLHRANAQNRLMVYHRQVSVLCIHSGVRRYSYLSSESPEHDRAWQWICAGLDERVRLLNSAATQMAGYLFEAQRALEKYRRPVLAASQAISSKIGVHPDSVQRFFDGMKKGAWVGDHTSFTRSAPPVIDPDQPILFGAGAGEDMIGQGWHPAEADGRWSSQESAEIFFTTEKENQVLEVSGYPLRPGDTAEFRINGKVVLTKPYQEEEQNCAIPVDTAGFNRLTIIVKNPTSPRELVQSEDGRVLAFRLSSAKLTASADPSPE